MREGAESKRQLGDCAFTSKTESFKFLKGLYASATGQDTEESFLISKRKHHLDLNTQLYIEKN